ncbi:MAG: FKBP-type peptidyl-prolyl cis-trans isomerase [Paramuribaculum sp.]|nr:FKBP-type peptidyl-prolyl cis-trans isomerase [Paramuribaculum sp.]
MLKLFYTGIIVSLLTVINTSCGKDDDTTWEDYAEWREANNEWYSAQAARTDDNGEQYYTLLQPAWYPKSGVLIHYFNDRKLTEGNLTPYTTSQVTVKYKGSLYDGTVFDSTTATGNDMTRTFGVSGLINGWQVALTDMRVGDTCEIIIPYWQGYGDNGSNAISPYSALKFNMRLVDIPDYEIP